MKGGTLLDRRILMKMIQTAGFKCDSHGGNHDKYKRGKDVIMLPRHRDINESLAKGIIKKWGLK